MIRSAALTAAALLSLHPAVSLAGEMPPGSGPQREPLARIGVFAFTTPRHLVEVCPVKVTFNASLEHSDNGRLPDSNYAWRWVRSDGAAGPVQHGPAGSLHGLRIVDTWQLGGKALPRYAGWEAVRVWWPSQGEASAVTSNHADFDMTCLGPPPPQPGAGGASNPTPHPRTGVNAQ